jgi:uncharacterized membrane protein
MLRLLRIGVFLLLLITPFASHAQTDAPNSQVSQVYLEKARVASTTSLGAQTEPWSGTQSQNQLVEVEVLEGPDKGKNATFSNNYIQVKNGDLVYVRHEVGGFDLETWALMDPYRLNVLMVIAVGFLALLLIFGGIQGIRGLASLLGSLGLIFYVLIPGVYSGFSPILVSIGVASLIIIAGSYITHGFNRTTTVAMLGMLGTVIITGIATYLAIHYAQLSGFTTEENAYLNLGTGGRINPIGLLYGGIMIGLLGVLYDIAIGQAVAVEELIAAGAHYTRKQIFNRSMRIGREHIGALVNTLAIAYVGASLPILLLFKDSTTSVAYIINSERFATEIIRILMGSAGLVLAVPITTLLAVYVLYGRKPRTEKASEGHHHS